MTILIQLGRLNHLGGKKGRSKSDYFKPGSVDTVFPNAVVVLTHRMSFCLAILNVHHNFFSAASGKDNAFSLTEVFSFFFASRGIAMF